MASMWTVVHSKHRMPAASGDEPKPEEPKDKKTVKEKVDDMGKDLCEGREDHPKCKRFFKDAPKPKPDAEKEKHSGAVRGCWLSVHTLLLLLAPMLLAARV